MWGCLLLISQLSNSRFIISHTRKALISFSSIMSDTEFATKRQRVEEKQEEDEVVYDPKTMEVPTVKELGLQANSKFMEADVTHYFPNIVTATKLRTEDGQDFGWKVYWNSNDTANHPLVGGQMPDMKVMRSKDEEKFVMKEKELYDRSYVVPCVLYSTNRQHMALASWGLRTIAHGKKQVPSITQGLRDPKKRGKNGVLNSAFDTIVDMEDVAMNKNFLRAPKMVDGEMQKNYALYPKVLQRRIMWNVSSHAGIPDEADAEYLNSVFNYLPEKAYSDKGGHTYVDHRNAYKAPDLAKWETKMYYKMKGNNVSQTRRIRNPNTKKFIRDSAGNFVTKRPGREDYFLPNTDAEITAVPGKIYMYGEEKQGMKMVLSSVILKITKRESRDHEDEIYIGGQRVQIQKMDEDDGEEDDFAEFEMGDGDMEGGRREEGNDDGTASTSEPELENNDEIGELPDMGSANPPANAAQSSYIDSGF